MEKKNADSYLIPHIKVNSRWVTEPSVKGETIKLLKENMERIFMPWGRQRCLKQDTKNTNHKGKKLIGVR